MTLGEVIGRSRSFCRLVGPTQAPRLGDLPAAVLALLLMTATSLGLCRRGSAGSATAGFTSCATPAEAPRASGGAESKIKAQMRDHLLPITVFLQSLS